MRGCDGRRLRGGARGRCTALRLRESKSDGKWERGRRDEPPSARERRNTQLKTSRPLMPTSRGESREEVTTKGERWRLKLKQMV